MHGPWLLAAAVTVAALVAPPIVGAASAAPPANDDFAQAQPITTGTVHVDNSEATAEAGEPTLCGMEPTHSLWYSYTPTESGLVWITAMGARAVSVMGWDQAGLLDFAECENSDPLVAVYVPIQVTAGKTYYIQVDTPEPESAYDIAPGPISLTVGAVGAPDPLVPNDDIEEAARLTRLVFAFNERATLVPDEPSIDGCAVESSVWFKVTPSTRGRMQLSADGWADQAGEFPVVVSVFRGSPGSLQEVACGTYRDFHRGARVVIVSEPGTTYWIQVGGSAGSDTSEGIVGVGYRLSDLAPPAHDDVGAGKPLLGRAGSVSSDLTAATPQPEDPLPASHEGFRAALDRSVWHEFVAPTTDLYTFDTLGSSVDDTTLGVYRGVGLGQLTEVAFNDSAAGESASRLSFQATRGETYHVLVNAWDIYQPEFGHGGYRLNWHADPNTGISGTVARAPGTRISYTLRATANPESATGPVVEVAVPAGLRVDAVTAPAGCVGETTLTCDFGATHDGTVTLLATPLHPGPHTIGARVVAGGAITEDDTTDVTATEALVCDRLGTGDGDLLGGSPASDIICGQDGPDVLRGLGGHDLIFGGTGFDTLGYGGAAATTVDLRRQGVGLVGAWPTGGISGSHGQDRFLGIEAANGSAYADRLIGDDLQNRLLGRGGDDLLVGNAGIDLLVGGRGDDTCRDHPLEIRGC